MLGSVDGYLLSNSLSMCLNLLLTYNNANIDFFRLTSAVQLEGKRRQWKEIDVGWKDCRDVGRDQYACDNRGYNKTNTLLI